MEDHHVSDAPRLTRPRICLVSGADEIRLRSYVNHSIYARTHGLDYRLECGLDRGIRNKFFYKTSIIRRVLPQYEWIVWIDDDAYFTDFDRDNINEFIADAEAADQFLVVANGPTEPNGFWSVINTGVVLFRNDPRTTTLLKLMEDSDLADVRKWWDDGRHGIFTNGDQDQMLWALETSGLIKEARIVRPPRIELPAGTTTKNPSPTPSSCTSAGTTTSPWASSGSQSVSGWGTNWCPPISSTSSARRCAARWVASSTGCELVECRWLAESRGRYDRCGTGYATGGGPEPFTTYDTIEHASNIEAATGGGVEPSMIIDRNVAPFAIRDDESILAALAKIDANQSRIVFVVDNHGHLLGSLTDGDLRRWLLATPGAALDSSAGLAANTNARRANASDPHATVAALIAHPVTHVPLVDDQGRLVGIASNDRRALHIGRRRIAADAPTLVIAEIGNNHQGDVGFAKHLVDLAVDAGADIVKFQLRDMDSLYRQTGAATGGEDLGAQYTLNLLAKYSLPAEQLIDVFDHAKARDVDILCTPWDSASVKVLADYGVPALKIASADLTNHALLHDVFTTGLPLVVSTGMSTEAEIIESTELLRSSASPFALLHCQSTYPAPFKDVHLNYLDRLAELGDCIVGYSGHERGWHVPLAAVAMGARIVEKHFTVDRSLEGNDHTVSLLPDEFRQMVSRIRELEEAMGNGSARVVSTGEAMNRVNLAKSLVATRRIEVGDRISQADVAVKSPGRGLQPNKLGELLGRTSRRVVDEGDFFYPGDLTDAVSAGRNYHFHRPWGLPVRYHDYAKLIEGTNPDFIEFHFLQGRGTEHR